MRNRTFTIHNIHIPCRRIRTTPFVIATIAGKQAKFSVYGKEVALIEGDVPQLVLGDLMKNIANYFSNRMEPAI